MTEINRQTLFILEKIKCEYETHRLVVGNGQEAYYCGSASHRTADTKIPHKRWLGWLVECKIDFPRFVQILEIIQNRGLFEQNVFYSDSF